MKCLYLFLDVDQLHSLLKQLEIRVTSLETKKVTPSPAKVEQKETTQKDEEDDDVDLFGSESEVNLQIYNLPVILHISKLLGIN